MSNLPGAINVAGILASGEFDIMSANNFTTRLEVVGSGFDAKALDLTTAFGIPPASVWSFGVTMVTNFAFLENDGSFDVDVDEAQFVNNADFVNITVPIPGTSLLIILGVAGLAARRRS